MTGVHTLWVARRVTSRQLVGRTGQLAALRSAADSAAHGAARIVLVSGDAGIGKTRLITEATSQARADGFVAALGGCVQLGEVSVAYAPLVEALRDLRTQLGEAALNELLGPGLVDIGALLGTGGGAAARSSGPLFEHLLGLLTRLGERQPVMLVFEDLHWADASTRDLAAFLGRNLRDASVVLLLTYRADELHRRHPLRPLIADLERDPQVERVALAGLERDDLVRLLGEISDDSLSDDIVDELLTRSDGNPFYIEELMAAGDVQTRGRGLPATLADVILDRVSRLSEPTQAVLHDAAVLGYEIDDVLLAQVTGQSVASVTAALREAVFDQLLVIDGDACRFRHALVREALYDDLLPGERERLHVATAAALETSDRFDEHARWALLAHHWDAAGLSVKAFAASLQAGREAERVHAFADAAAQYERALRLYDRLPDQGIAQADLLMLAANAINASSARSRAVTLAEAALRELGDDAIPEQRALVLERIGRFNWSLHGPAAAAAYEQAVAVLVGRPASREHAYALSGLGQSLMLRNRYQESEQTLNRAIAMASAVGANDVHAHALCSLGATLAGMGRVEEGVDVMHRALELSVQFGTDEDTSRVYTNLTHVLYFGARYDDAAHIGAEGIAYSVRTGYQRGYGQSILGNWILAMICAGRWDDAEAVRADPRILSGDSYQELRWLPLLLGRGRLAEASRLVERTLADTLDTNDVQFRGQALLRAAELAGIKLQWDDARSLIADALALARSSDDQYYRAQIYGLGVWIEAEQRDAEAADALAAEAVSWGTGVGTPLPEVRAWLATVPAERSRAHGTDTADEWAAVAAVWDEVGQPYRAALARYRQSDALLRSRSRDEAGAVAREVLRVASSLGAEPLATQVRQLAQRARLDLAGPVATPRDPVAALNLTPREVDVLTLLAQGRTNRQIGESLFISEKTASVHVTNLLRKLGVPNRIEAAAIAQRVGL